MCARRSGRVWYARTPSTMVLKADRSPPARSPAEAPHRHAQRARRPARRRRRRRRSRPAPRRTVRSRARRERWPSAPGHAMDVRVVDLQRTGLRHGPSSPAPPHTVSSGARRGRHGNGPTRPRRPATTYGAPVADAPARGRDRRPRPRAGRVHRGDVYAAARGRAPAGQGGGRLHVQREPRRDAERRSRSPERRRAQPKTGVARRVDRRWCRDGPPPPAPGPGRRGSAGSTIVVLAGLDVPVRLRGRAPAPGGDSAAPGDRPALPQAAALRSSAPSRPSRHVTHSTAGRPPPCARAWPRATARRARRTPTRRSARR